VEVSKSLNEPNSNNNELLRENAGRPILKFKHTGPIKPGEPSKDCDVPLGICFILGIQDGIGDLSKAEIAEGINTADIIVLNPNKMKIVPDTNFAYPDGTIEIQNNFHVNEKVSNKLGFKHILVKKGIYSVNKNEGKFGSVTVDIVATPRN